MKHNSRHNIVVAATVQARRLSSATAAIHFDSCYVGFVHIYALTLFSLRLDLKIVHMLDWYVYIVLAFYNFAANQPASPQVLLHWYTVACSYQIKKILKR